MKEKENTRNMIYLTTTTLIRIGIPPTKRSKRTFRHNPVYKPDKEPKTTKQDRCEYASRKYKELVQCRSTACIVTVESKQDVYVSAVSSDSAKSENSISPGTKSSLSFDRCPPDDDSQTVEHNPDGDCTVDDILIEQRPPDDDRQIVELNPDAVEDILVEQRPPDEDIEFDVQNPDEACTVDDILVEQRPPDDDSESDGQNPVDIQFQLRINNEIELNKIRECHKIKMLHLMEKEIELEMKMNQIREEHKRKYIELIKEENDAEFEHAKRMRHFNLS